MKAAIFRFLILGCILSLSPQPSSAEDAPFSRRLKADFQARSHDILDSLWTEDIVIGSAAAIQKFGQIIIPTNKHFTDMTLLEAYTLKPDGRKIDVAPEKILTSTLPNAALLGVFEADSSLTTIVFPDVAVGDVIHYKRKALTKINPLPGGFQFVSAVTASLRYDEVEFNLTTPADIEIQDEAIGFDKVVTALDDKRVYHWQMRPQPFRADEPATTSSLDRDSHLIFSSYPDKATIANAFFDKAKPKSLPTPALIKLADEITKDITDRREQAKAIHDWVTRNIRYYAIYFGNGGFVPHDAEAIAKDKYGDCKDHTTLMRALLAVKGIDADYALISLQPLYKPRDNPFNLFNHVILYLPEFDLYDDPTSDISPFGILPILEADKQILRVGDKGVVDSRTEPLKPETNRIVITSDVSIRANGTAMGQAITSASGPVSSELRRNMAIASQKGYDNFAKELLKSTNWKGIGSIAPKDFLDHSEPYVVETHFDLENRFFGAGGNRNAIPYGPRFFLPPYMRSLAVVRDKTTQDYLCGAITYQHYVTMTLPDGQTLDIIPSNVTKSGAYAQYTSHYLLDGQVLKIDRTFVMSPPGQVCTPDMARQMEPVLRAAAIDFSFRPKFKG